MKEKYFRHLTMPLFGSILKSKSVHLLVTVIASLVQVIALTRISDGQLGGQHYATWWQRQNNNLLGLCGFTEN